MNLVEDFTKWLRLRSSGFKVSVVTICDFMMFVAAVFVAYALRISAVGFPPSEKIPLYLLAPLLSVIAGFVMRIYWTASRSYTMDVEKRIVVSQLGAACVWVLLLFALGTTGFARSVVIIYTLLAIGGMILLRRSAAYFLDHEGRAIRVKTLPPCLVYGAGQEGQQVVEALRRQNKYRPVAFVDTDYTLVGRQVAGLQVFDIENLNIAAKKHDVRDIIIAKPGLSRSGLRDLFHISHQSGLSAKLVPNLGQLLDGKVGLGELREILVEDLLGRDPVPPDTRLLDKATKGLVVMVTGAGGSIGSELVRQVVLRGPSKLVLVEHSEFSLFEIHREIENWLKIQDKRDIELVAVLADVKNKSLMADILATHKVEVVFHAAAYKHVRMVQENVTVGIDNNVFGTKAVAEAAMEHGVKRFILISTDKAVRPTSVMGASKRVAEMIVQALAAKSGHTTIFSMVRFGNVLGSTGSVVPLFREQIANGGPLLVTHENVTRYFMLIPEAAQLVIQAGAMAEGGEVFVLDMGEPIKIIKLARTMIELAGLTEKTTDNPAGDIEIKVIGLRDGEKLYEELQIGTEVISSEHERIMRSKEFFLPLKSLNRELDSLRRDQPEISSVRLFSLANSKFD